MTGIFVVVKISLVVSLEILSSYLKIFKKKLRLFQLFKTYL